MIDLRSDTVTKPTTAMRAVMAEAPVGDDVFGDDPSINRLEEEMAAYFGKEAGLYCPSGTMANQIAIRCHTRPGDQVICSWAAHIYNYEGGGIALNSGATVKLLEGDRGLFTAAQVKAAICADDPHLPVSRLVSIEDTSNKGGGATWDTNEITSIAELCKAEGLSLHLDGARLFNRLVAQGDNPVAYATAFESISICMSKGLGAPVGSVLLGSKDFIHRARRARKALGGGMRQAGIIAAGCLHALHHHVDRLAEDHAHAQQIAQVLEAHPLVSSILPVETNIIIFNLESETACQAFLSTLEAAGVRAVAMGPKSIRFVLHLDVSAKDVLKVMEVCKKLRL